jgi:chloramphenicol O-acetyltransferase type A
MKTYIDMESYPRRSHFEYFRSLAYPYVGFTANVDVTNLIRYAKEHQASSFLAILWTAAQAANAVPELRQDIEGDCIVQYDHCDIGHTVALPDHTFCNCHTKTQMSLDDYLVYAKEQQEEAKLHPGFVNQEEPEIGMIFASCVPWVAFTQCIQPVPIPADCNPRIVFGKFIKEGDRTLMPLHIQCNHALVDGYHLGLFYQEFEKIAASV